MTDPITPEQIEKLVAVWFYALDIHAPIQECYKMLAGDGLEMHFPDGDIWDLATFKDDALGKVDGGLKAIVSSDRAIGKGWAYD